MATQYTAGLSTGQVLTAATLNTIGAVFETWTPNFRPETGTWTTAVTSEARYGRINKFVYGFGRVAISNFGTGNGAVFFDLPVAARYGAPNPTIGMCREQALTGDTCNIYLLGSTTAAIRRYNNGTTANSNSTYPVVFFYEAA